MPRMRLPQALNRLHCIMKIGRGFIIAYAVAMMLALVSSDPVCASSPETDKANKAMNNNSNLPEGHERATLGGGCFWCIEAVYEKLEGVTEATSGYMGGEVENPSYQAVCTGNTGHAEVVQLVYNPELISYEELLDWFWRMHDPTTLNRQGADVGTQYRSVIFYHDEAQKAAIEQSLANAQKQFDVPIVTEVAPAETFYPAEAYHQDYYANNTAAGYCQVVIKPKLKKLDLE